MDFLKHLIIVATSFCYMAIQAQPSDKTIAAFSKSFQLESEKKYAQAGSALTEVYNKDTYEINLRLGWLFYKAGMYPESESYYQRAVELMPYAAEPKLGLVQPKAAVITSYSIHYTKLYDINDKLYST